MATARTRSVHRSGFSGWSVLNPAWLIRILLIVSMVPLGNRVAAETVDRLSLVVFSKVNIIRTVYDHWPHTFEIHFPQIDLNVTQPDSISCNSSPEYLQACKSLQSAVHTLRFINDHYVSQQQHLLKMVRHILQAQTPTPVPPSRSKRALLPFIGSLSHTLFGTATSKEVNRLKEHILSLENKEITMASQFEKHSKDLSSFMSLTNDRLSSFKTHIADNHEAIIKVTHLFSKTTHTNEVNLKFTMHIVKNIYLSMALQENLLQFVLGMQALINHNLSPLLIPITDMKSTILNINARLRKSNSELFVRDMSSHELYSDPKFHWTFTKSSLYITYYFPLSSSIPDLTLYKIHNIPVPLDNNSSHVTVLTNLPNYLALSNDQHYFTYFDNYPGSKHSNFIDASDTNVPLFSIAQSSCITALFFEHRHRQLKNSANTR